MLDTFSRGAIFGLAALCVAGAAQLTPLPARSFFDKTGLREPRPTVRPAAEAVGILAVGRDPFAEPAPAEASPAVPPVAVVAPSAPLVKGKPGVLPSNLIGDTIPALPGAPFEPDAPPEANTAARVTAIVTGAHPFALVESAGDHQIKGVGDRVDDVPIVAIEIDGIRLQNGRRLRVDPASRP